MKRQNYLFPSHRYAVSRAQDKTSGISKQINDPVTVRVEKKP
jgi:hypothetical protein